MKETVHVPLSKSYARVRLMRILIGLLMLFGGIGAMIGGAVAADEVSGAVGASIAGCGLLSIIVALIILGVTSQLVTAKRISEDYIWLKGAKEPFLDELPQWYGES